MKRKNKKLKKKVHGWLRLGKIFRTQNKVLKEQIARLEMKRRIGESKKENLQNSKES